VQHPHEKLTFARNKVANYDGILAENIAISVISGSRCGVNELFAVL
jgi:hypothetical protein